MTEPRPKPADKPADETIKETFESIVIAFILAFVFRAYVVEAFVIPTGSMAPTLLGAHLHVRCDQCGYEFNFDPPEEAVLQGQLVWPSPSHQAAVGAVCPMCLAPNPMERGTTLNSGDRILVHKFVYSFSEPRRWDVVVFKAPHEPETNYIKRLVGLPDEQLYLFEGNVYVRPVGAESRPAGDWRIARKTTRPQVQRAVWQPVYHSNYIPRDEGQRHFDPRYNWSVPWVAQGPTADAWDLRNRRSYHYPHVEPGTVHFDFGNAGVHNPALVYPYNQFKRQGSLEAIEDLRVAARIEPLDTPVGITFSTVARLNNPDVEFGRERLTVTLTPAGDVTLEAHALAGERRRVLERGRVAPLPVGRATAVEFWYADQEASLWIDGDRVLAWRYDLPLERLIERERPASRPQVALTVQGGPVNLHNVQLDRDLYYSNRLGSKTARGALLVGSLEEPLALGADEFFCLGDNGPQSSDGRYWDHTNRWIEESMLQARIDADLSPDGIVPRDLMMGRAFFVYFPAPYSVGRIPLPNFGDMRFIR